MKKLLAFTLITAAVFCLAVGECGTKVTNADVAKNKAKTMLAVNNGAFATQYAGANMNLASTNQFSSADVDTSGVAGLGNAGGLTQQSSQMDQVGYAEIALDPSRDNGSFSNPDGTTTSFDISMNGTVAVVILTTDGYAFFIDNVTATIVVETNGTLTNSSDDTLLDFSYTIYFFGGTIMSVNADLSTLYTDGEVTLVTAVTHLPWLFGVSSVQDTIVVDTAGTFEDGTDDHILGWERDIVYTNSTHQVFTLSSPTGTGPVVADNGMTVLTILTEDLPAITGLENVSDILHVDCGNLDNTSDDTVLYWKRTINATNGGILILETNQGAHIVNGQVDLYITGSNIPDETYPTQKLTIDGLISVNNLGTSSEADDIAKGVALTVTNTTTGGSFEYSITDVDGDNNLHSGTAKVTFVAIPQDGVGLSDSLTVEIEINPQGTKDETDDLLKSLKITDDRRDGSTWVLVITPSTPCRPNVKPAYVTLTCDETFPTGAPKFDIDMTIQADNSATGTVRIYTLSGTSMTFSVSATSSGIWTVTKV
jgi:hypothetical protein